MLAQDAMVQHFKSKPFPMFAKSSLGMLAATGALAVFATGQVVLFHPGRIDMPALRLSIKVRNWSQHNCVDARTHHACLLFLYQGTDCCIPLCSDLHCGLAMLVCLFVRWSSYASLSGVSNHLCMPSCLICLLSLV